LYQNECDIKRLMLFFKEESTLNRISYNANHIKSWVYFGNGIPKLSLRNRLLGPQSIPEMKIDKNGEAGMVRR